MTERKPRLWSDFDGTAVTSAPKYHPLNWSKYPRPMIAGYDDFLEGVHSTGVEIAGVVSRRPDILVRRLATSRSVAKLGLASYFGAPGQVVLAGSERAKGNFIAEQSRFGVVGMLEDKPYKLGSILLGALQEPLQHPEDNHNPILMGVAPHGRSAEYIERLVERVAKSKSNFEIAESPLQTTVYSDKLTLHVTPLESYTREAGQAFGHRLLQLAA